MSAENIRHAADFFPQHRRNAGVPAVPQTAEGSAQLKCAVCLWCEFLDRELETGFARPAAAAATTVDGTALCSLHMEDFKRTRDAFTSAENIVRICKPEAFSRY